jgi:hypothetical protein
MNLEPLFNITGNVQTRWDSSDNWGAEKGSACQDNDGRKRSPCFPLGAGESANFIKF